MPKGNRPGTIPPNFETFAAARAAGHRKWTEKVRRPNIDCAGCGKSFHPLQKTTRFCSQACANKPGVKSFGPRHGERGALHHNWKGGITPENHRIRTSLEYRQWRDAVFQRDDFTCVLCGTRGGDMHADHIKPFATFPDLRLEVTNGRTLCPPCHRDHGENPARRS